jgi:hypothetical protein
MCIQAWFISPPAPTPSFTTHSTPSLKADYFIFLFETGSRYVAQDGLKLMIILSPSPKCCDYKGAPLHPVLNNFLFCFCFFCVVLGSKSRAYYILRKHSTTELSVQPHLTLFYFYIYLFLVVLEFALRSLHFLGKCSFT